MPAARVGLLITAIGLWAIVTDDLRLRITRGEGGTDADVPADGGPEALPDERAEWVRSAASLGRRAERAAEDAKVGTASVVEPV
jgi:hypothetical protein